MKIWCQVCAKHKEEPLDDPTLKRVAAATKDFINGTNNVMKHQVKVFISYYQSVSEIAIENFPDY